MPIFFRNRNIVNAQHKLEQGMKKHNGNESKKT